MKNDRTVLDFNADWRFHKGFLSEDVLGWGNRAFNAGEVRLLQKSGNHGLSKPECDVPDSWPSVTLPHDFVIEGDFTPEASVHNGSLKGDFGHYVKRFELAPEDETKRIRLEFDGAFRDAEVHVNGQWMGSHRSGYTSFVLDVTEACRFGGPNAVSVSLDARMNELWSYEGGGLYRGVRLVKTPRVHVAPWGISFAPGGEKTPGAWEVGVELASGSHESANGTARLEWYDPEGEKLPTIAPSPFRLEPYGATELRFLGEVPSPRLWSPEDPALYLLRVIVENADGSVDVAERRLGFRHFRFDAAEGFFLNGRHLKLKGVCCHQDHAGVGVAVTPALQEWRMRKLRTLGVNALRTAHNPPDPALLDACDRLGVLVMDEIRMPGTAPELLKDFEDFLRRDRHHPSVILWSLGNEEMRIQKTDSGVAIFRRMQAEAHRLDPTRPATYAMNCDWMDIAEMHDAKGFRFDVFGANYRHDQRSERYDEFHAKWPDWPLVGSETWGGTATRGLYEPDCHERGVTLVEGRRNNPACWLDGGKRPFASAYGNFVSPWGYSIEEAWRDCASRPHLAGTFLWTGFDYRGETSPYEYPAVVTRYGILDLCGFEKEVAHYLRAWWIPETPHLFLMPHWDWQGKEGETIDVRCYGNVARVELRLNGKTIDRREMPVNGRLDWEVPYESGTLEAIGTDAEGKEIARTRRVTTTGARKIVLARHLEEIPEPDGKCRIAVIDARVVDAQGEVCPRAANEVEFHLDGDAEILGVGNGDPMSHEKDKGASKRRAYHGLCQVIVRAKGPFDLRATGWGLGEATLAKS